MKQLIINGKPIGSIWKTNKPVENTPAKTEPKTQGKPNTKHEDGKRAIPFIPESYSDPTASAAINNIMWEQELEQRQMQRQNKKTKNKRRRKHHMRS